MDDSTLTQMLRRESDRVERKRNGSDRTAIRRAVCALANDLPDHRRPGVVFVGVEDDGSCSNEAIDDALLKKLSEMRSDGKLQPFPSIKVQKKTLDGCEMAVVVVEPADAPPVRLDGRVFVRVGPTTRQASPQEERRLAEKRRAGDLPFDLRPLPSASLDDLDLVLFEREYLPEAVAREVLEANERTIGEQLASLRMMAPDGTPTVLGVLTLGKDPRRFVPGDYVQFLRVEGDQLGDPIKDAKEIEGPLPALLTKLDDVLKAHVSTSVDLTTDDRELRHPDYPIAALQQLTRNAVMHRTYEGTYAPSKITWLSDRIEIYSPGGPFGQVTKANFGESGITDYRNPHLAAVMKDLGFVQRFGVGIQTARRELEKNGNPPLKLEPHDQHVLVTVRKRR